MVFFDHNYCYNDGANNYQSQFICKISIVSADHSQSQTRTLNRIDARIHSQDREGRQKSIAVAVHPHGPCMDTLSTGIWIDTIIASLHRNPQHFDVPDGPARINSLDSTGISKTIHRRAITGYLISDRIYGLMCCY